MRLKDIKEYFNTLPDDVLNTEFGIIINDVRTDVEGLFVSIELIPDNFFNTLDTDENRGIQDITWSSITPKYVHGTLKIQDGTVSGHVKCNTNSNK